jgi:hypothetical protein
MKVSGEDAEATVRELDNAPVDTGKDGDVCAAEQLVFKLRVAALPGAEVIVADPEERFGVRHDQEMRVKGDTRADGTAVQAGGLGDAEQRTAEVRAEMNQRY